MKQAKHPTDANGNLLQEGIRVYTLDFDGETVLGTLIKSEVPETLGRWCIRYDDGKTFVVLDFDQVWKA